MFLTDVLVFQEVVGHLDQRAEAHVDFGLPGRGHLMMMDLDRQCRIF